MGSVMGGLAMGLPIYRWLVWMGGLMVWMSSLDMVGWVVLIWLDGGLDMVGRVVGRGSFAGWFGLVCWTTTCGGGLGGDQVQSASPVLPRPWTQIC